MAVAQSGTTGSLDLEIHDPALSVTNVQFAKKADAGSYGSLATTWDRSTGTIGASVDLTRGEDITLTSKHAVSIRWVVTYTDDAGGSRTLEGAHSFDSDLIAEVTNIGVAFNANGEAVVSATGDEDAADLYVTVSDGSAPADPTAGTNDGSISGRTGTVDTGVKITTGSEAFVRVVAADSGGTLGPVVQTRQERRLGPFHKDTTARSASGTTETTLATITIPGGKLGLNGTALLTMWFSVLNATSTVTIRAYLEGDQIISKTLPAGLAVTAHGNIQLSANNADDEQVSRAFLMWPGTVETASLADGDHAADSTADMDITITGQKANAGDILTLVTSLMQYAGTN
jgi:hypothetical protein